MLQRPKKKEKALAEKIADNILHPNESGSESDFAEDTTAARVIDYESDEYELPGAETTEFRKRSIRLLSEHSAKYKGKIVSRKDFESDISEGESNYEKSDSEDDEELKSFHDQSKKQTEDSDSEEDDYVDGGAEESEDVEDDDKNDSELDTEDEDDDDADVEIISKVNHEDEIQKGICVQNQLNIWERLLEFRINLQKLLNKTNQLPSSEEQKDLEKSNKEYNCMKGTASKQIYLLLENLLTLKNLLSSQYSEIEKVIKPLKRPPPVREHNCDEPPLKQISQYLDEGFGQFRNYRNEVLLKWDDRTKLLQPGAGSKKKSFNEEYDVIKKIDNALINKSQLIEKSQEIKTQKQNVSIEKNRQNPNPNVYDDTDFYHQQLRELIEYKANTTSHMSEVTKQFVELQKLRQKMKKKVDTRASKGRKLRYIVHNKLINFMAPNDNTTWTVESIDELKKSLFV